MTDKGDKITWENIYRKFRATYPNLRKRAIHWEPYGYAEIKIWLDDQSKMVFNYDLNQARFIERN